jgi:hypothetical protein
MPAILPFITLVASGIFTGAAIFINVAEHPARISCLQDSPGFVLKQWRQSYQRAAIMQALLAASTFLFGVLSYFCYQKQFPFMWLCASIMFGSIIPFTLVFMMPINHYLQSAHAGDAVSEKLQKWEQLHGVRSVVSTFSFLIFVWCVVNMN